MKRDMDLVREMLFAIEAGGGWFTGAKSLKIEGHDDDTIRYHLAILVDADIVKQETMSVYKGSGISAVKISERPGSHRMTWAGTIFSIPCGILMSGKKPRAERHRSAAGVSTS